MQEVHRVSSEHVLQGDTHGWQIDPDRYKVEGHVATQVEPER